MIKGIRKFLIYIHHEAERSDFMKLPFLDSYMQYLRKIKGQGIKSRAGVTNQRMSVQVFPEKNLC